MNSLIGFWLVAAAVVVLIHRFVPLGGWLMLHLLLLGAVSTAILIWSQHFADTLLRRSAWGGRRFHGVRLVAHTVGAAVVVAGMVADVWPLVLVGGFLVGLNATVHAASLIIQGRGGLPARFAPLVRYYVFAGISLAAGVTLGVILARTSLPPELHDRLMVGHLGANLLGWVGLTVIGTVILLWPTVLHTRVSETTDASARRALPLLVSGVGVFVTGSIVGIPLVVAVAVVIYLAGFGMIVVEGIRAWRASPPTTYAAWSIAAAVGWLLVCTVALGAIVVFAPSWEDAGEGLDWLAAPFAVGFAAQIVLGALSYLLPVVLGGGPSAARATAAELDRGAFFRVLIINAGIVLYLLPVPSLVAVVVSFVVFATLLSFLVLAIRAVRAGTNARGGPTVPVDAADASARTAGAPKRHSGAALLAVGTLLVATTLGIALDPASAGLSMEANAPTIKPTGNTTTVEISMNNMRFTPDTIEVPAGDRLVIELSNVDTVTHDLVLENGATSGRVSAGKAATVDAGVIAANVDGWCSIAGHRQMGMVLTIVVTGGAVGDASGDAEMPGDHGSGDSDGPSAAEDLDLMAQPAAGFTARDATLPPASSATVRNVALSAQDREVEVSPGVTQTLWTFNGTAPGPTLRGNVGDKFNITLVNDADIGHSIDFHAGSLAPDQPMRTIDPGESLSFSFTATRSGIWLYHCSTAPMSVHIANGMFGAVIIDPPGIAQVDREFIVVQSELYLGPQGGTADAAKVQTQMPDLVVFNGYANQYRHDPLEAKVGERVRVWVLDAGPNLPSSFHIVGGQFDTVYSEGDYRLKEGGSTGTGGSQSLGLLPAQGGFVELVFPEAGNYPFITHTMSDAERGAFGLFRVTD
ncbi:multicopper oxidase domain-containing protein [Salinibacterium sp. UTAS2018]|uniref:multicopper oxidase domain-containing protein n=1 Tax=Salinibacterium sp. UTAS2018 TaxID=2508880 RepID=UPI001FEFFB7F|nr:multicopper oxidase domain-containing protein [Salinibacterium sp. UTAS2018]